MLIARDKEKKMLSDLLKKDESSFVAVYGRRRIGKTYLIRETLGDSFIFQHSGYYGGKLSDQLFAFSTSLREYGTEEYERPKSWLEAFEQLKDLIRRSEKTGKKVIFLDELSWMDTKGSDLIMAIEGFWNGWASARKDIVLIVCGSATTWMISNVVHNKGGLYNRLSFAINLQPFTLKECEEYIQSRNIVMNRHQIIECYMILGGVAYYWSLLQRGLSLPQNIDEMFFSRKALLKNEFEYLYASIFKNPQKYMDIITALGTKKTGMTRQELLSATGMANSGTFSNRLDDLESCGFIRKYYELGKSERNAVYQLIDNFTLFYFKFMKKKVTDEHFWSNRRDSAGLNAWCGLAFEMVCLEHVAQIKNALGIAGVSTEVKTLSCSADADKGIVGSQIDLMIVRRDQVINLCEMKYSRKVYTVTKKVDADITNKINDLRIVTGTRYAIHPVLVTVYGIAENSYFGNIQNVITADDLFG